VACGSLALPVLAAAYGRVVAVAYGLIMGSAVTAIAWRVPRRLSWVRGRSACPSCEAPLGPLDLVPVFSFALARGRCRHCGARIGWRYPLTELMCAAWSLLLYLKVGQDWVFLPLSLWGFLLVALLWIDLEFRLLPDALTFPGTALGIAAALLSLGWGPGARHALLGIAAGSGVLWLLAWAWITFRKVEGMGAGDVKLAAMFGAVLGWKLTLLTLFVAALAGTLWGGVLILRRRGGMRSELPFGTLLAPAALIVFRWGGTWIDAYVRLLTRH
jgi:leader peptidase (prepilin peptidase) / N-methyltransferase